MYWWHRYTGEDRLMRSVLADLYSLVWLLDHDAESVLKYALLLHQCVPDSISSCLLSER